ncbi:SUMF1/EgtB/PvdO family nonheme iron enzyme [Acinetobacter radioresistens]|uniref:SUMF1/EgtB/PvdO family nonheme iron enzyme n=1 Tax=Acinetobacter radioresistens TaxID=40216 RepID=UPI00203020A2|nr:SUMF1/EgtB/PvdO family nonheme iron enzyme [Acinetobacter radioresistens]MCM1935998.1 formylglycine-generating enzyme family protein [Acinetobacter radioresistens]MCM1953779.1 formylglycine-generating enzyme family protein [Acinetobacter radioresistens]MCU4308382.1 formylglycine-generating enzyme family protein [Acinetobacter radioresistens]MCU4566445.1 formylglycine-generating enzyme family protein [Acinetobacter radioresistens]
MKLALRLGLCSLLFAGCHNTEQNSLPTNKKNLNLGNITYCQSYSGLPSGWLEQAHAGMLYIPKGEVKLGSELAYPDEINFGAQKRKVKGFWIDQTEVTVAQFASFIAATHYITDAEKQNEAAVFEADEQSPQQWWKLKSGYNWRLPEGPEGPPARANEAVRYITKNDAEHYALWLGHDLPSEVEWEYAAKGNDETDVPLKHEPRNHQHRPDANYWQGDFPFHNTQEDHFKGIAPVGCFSPNTFGLYDMIGNVWEWTSSVYTGAHDEHMGNYSALRTSQHIPQSFVIKGGSFLCASQYCARYRKSSRHPQEFNLATTHTGFRTIDRGK